MASRTSTDPIEILLEMGVDLDNLSEEEDYLSALKEAIATIQFQTKGAGDERSTILQQEVIKVRKQRKAADTRFKARKTTVSKSKLLGTSAIVPKKTQIKKEQLLALPPAAEEKEDKKKKPKEKNLLKEIAQSVTNIADILKKQYKLKEKSTEQDRKRAEQQKRKLQEAGLEKRFQGILKTAEKIVAPVRSIFDRILQFLTNILLGKFLVKLVEWISDPDNRSKITSIIRFLTDNWPKLLSAYILFGTGIGKFSRFLVKVLARGAIRLAAATAGLLARLFGARGLGRFSRFLGKRGKLIAGGIEAVTTIFAFKALEDSLTKNLGPEESASIDNDIPVSGYQDGGLVQPIFKFEGGGSVGFNLLNPFTWFSGKGQQAVDSKKTGAYSDDTLSGRLLNRRNATNEAIRKMRGYEEGGEVDGPSGIDKVPAMLTDGEFVMSRGAVQKYGVSQLEAMNAAGGGTNRPKIMNGTVFAKDGGYMGDRERAPDKELNPVKKFSDRFIMGDRSLLNQLALGNTKEALETLGIKIDNNTKAVNQNTNQRREDNKTIQGLKKFINNSQKNLESGMSSAVEFAQKLNPLPGMGRALSSFAENPYMGEEAIDKLTQERIASGELGEDGLGLTKTTQANLDKNDAYIRSLYDPEKDTGFIGGLKKMNQTIQNKGAILDPLAALGLKEEGTEKFIEKITGGRVKNFGAKLTGLQMAAKGLAGPLGRMFQIDDRGSLGRYLRPAMEEAQRQGHTSVGREALGGETYDRLVNDKLANLALGQVHFEVDEQGRAKTSDVFDASAMTPKQYLTKSRESLSLVGDILQGKADGGPVGIAKALYQSAFMGLSGRLATAQNSGFGNLRPMGLDIDLGGGFAPKKKELSEKQKQSSMDMIMGGKDAYYSSTTQRYYKNYEEALKDPQVAAAAKIEETKKKLSFAPTQPSKVTIPSMPTNASGSNVTVVKAPSKSAPAAEGNTGSSVPAIDAGNGNKSKWKIFGMSWPF